MEGQFDEHFCIGGWFLKAGRALPIWILPFLYMMLLVANLS
jgi:hypothetical protein